jgi:hypothetical protein
MKAKEQLSSGPPKPQPISFAGGAQTADFPSRQDAPESEPADQPMTVP